MSEKAKKTVWILGAGFSRPLGGPLLPDLISRPVYARLGALYPGSEYAALRTALARTEKIYQHDAVDAKRTFWRNPEEFLDMLDAATISGTVTERLALLHELDPGLAKPRDEEHALEILKEWSSQARLAVAAACHHFCAHADTKSERWSPYKRWARQLTQADTVLSFNYDTVVERVSNNVECPIPDDAHDLASFDSPLLLKLHGSIRWHLHETKVFEEEDVDKSLQKQNAFLIGTPGPTKFDVASKKLAVLWKIAMDRLRSADNIVFVGFRFPETDAHAKQKILETIGQNKNKYLTIRIVLGPYVNHPDPTRLEGMLRWANKERRILPGDPLDDDKEKTNKLRIVIEPMWAEDFLSVYGHDQLTAFRI